MTESASDLVTCAPLVLDTRLRLLAGPLAVVDVTAMECAMLTLLMRHPEGVPKERLANEIFTFRVVSDRKASCRQLVHNVSRRVEACGGGRSLRRAQKSAHGLVWSIRTVSTHEFDEARLRLRALALTLAAEAVEA